ncbi:hypothetical protein [Caulobacter sp. BE254]|uniref:hypothetical protein n=1 Tax=Caulobacter sp. BE254 TaxID=2817720 RepID=UPI002854BC57|nr:hypothetical protein [Caulobacter sp. BE254]MDR7117730.1 hypothetical protein [Caulobacter sp. BE254]
MKWGNWLVGGCCTIFVLVIVTPTGVYEGISKLSAGKDAAAWVQAVGSIIAILAAVAVAAYQNHHENKRRSREINTAMYIRMQAAMWASDMAVAAIASVPGALQNDEQLPALAEFGFPQHTFDDAAATIDRLPLHEYESAEVAVALSLLRTLIRGSQERAKILVELLRNGNSITEIMWEDLEERIEDALKHRDLIHAIGTPTA